MVPGDLSQLPSVDRLLSSARGADLVITYGHEQAASAIRVALNTCRDQVRAGGSLPTTDLLLESAACQLAADNRSQFVPVLNLTGTILHTNLGRAPLPQVALESIASVARGASNLEFDLDTGNRGDRDDHIEPLIRTITGAEAATVVNNNAAAVLLTLNSLALGREVPVSRGELVEIGGSFRIPEIMARAGCRLVETGATNRTHASDFEAAITAQTALLMKVHTSNYEIVGFTATQSERELADIAHRHGLPLVVDLGSGTLVDLTRFGLPREPTVQETLEAGADLVTFSGDKLLGGPQAGIIAGRRDLIDQIKRNPMKRALRVDKMTLAGLYEVLRLYRNPDALVRTVPTLRLLTRDVAAIRHLAESLCPAVAAAVASVATVLVVPCQSQVGSGALPTSVLPGYALSVTPHDGSDRVLQALTLALRKLPVPVIGRIHDGALLLDLRTLEDPAILLDSLARLKLP